MPGSPSPTSAAAALRGRRRGVVLAAAALATGAVAGSTPQRAGTAPLEPTLARAATIRAEVSARYRTLPGRKLAVTEATTTGVVPHLTLIDPGAGTWRLVPAENGVYFAICTAPARCPFRARGSSWVAGAFLPRRQALELALRTFSETPASLVVVSLPTAEPLWVVFEREEVLEHLDTAALLRRLEGRPNAAPAPLLRALVFALTRARLFVPIPVLPPPRDTLYAVRLPGS